MNSFFWAIGNQQYPQGIIYLWFVIFSCAISGSGQFCKVYALLNLVQPETAEISNLHVRTVIQPLLKLNPLPGGVKFKIKNLVNK
jgi:hypothetical protein